MGGGEFGVPKVYFLLIREVENRGEINRRRWRRDRGFIWLRVTIRACCSGLRVEHVSEVKC